MSLSRLPPEILLYILGYLGSKFFAHDLRYLTISRTWYHLAWSILLRDLHFTTRSLRRFTDNEIVFERSPLHIVTVDLSLVVRDESSQSPPTDDLREASGNEGGIDTSSTQLDSSLAKLAALLLQCLGIQSLRVQARGEGRALQLGGPAYLHATPLTGLLSLPHLTSLELDTAGCHLGSPPNSNVHLCRSINSLLPSLRRLRCRMEEICETLLERPPSNTALEEVIVNLSISQISDTITSYRCPKRCKTVARDFSQLKLAMETKAATLATLLRNPRTLRVISHELPSLNVYAFDAITGKRMLLANNVEWDADGELVDDVVEEDEDDLFDSDSPVTPQIVW
ncbi:uncharacterized protein B0H64DRAFT_364618 [Chaetomium fimeti]|uniref:F-box domain-containing protein n=1 Tax=Chaetomium fimeti TaxID=1854472 RepID=A0AAE0HC08_9PEZI|nr:hypothetical protein B0H64DRAFT_364618 [Chaetomium fimeti]